MFLYRKNGEYTVDNLATERAIRPLVIQRKNSLFFGSTQGALNLTVYNTFSRLANKTESRLEITSAS
ncbi:transposase [Bacteroides stercorirosoris]|uniref:IS66 family transposase n=1 Tax=Bacteroides stercorirosoris TaxID=871324 RepID=UPI0030B807A9